MITGNLGTDARFTTRHFEPSAEPAGKRPRSVAQAVELAVAMVDDRALNPVTRMDAGVAFQTRTLLALLTFCYARQVYSSSAIAAQMRRDSELIRVNGQHLPDANMLQRFRAENRGPLSFCLRSVLQFVAEEKIRQGFVTHVRQAHITQEASRRIVMAMFTDSLEMKQESRTDVAFELSVDIAAGRRLRG